MKKPFHPVFLAAWPVLFLFAANIGETELRDVVPPLLAVIGAAIALVGLLTLLVRDVRRAALVTSVIAVAALTYGHVENLTGGPVWLLPAWLALTVLLIVVVLRARGVTTELTTMANGVSAILVVLVLVSIVSSGQVLADDPVPPPPTSVEGINLEWAGEGPPRDVYYLVFDRYGSVSSLDTLYGIDNGPFMAQLEERGFNVLPDSRANHLRTTQSLASSLNMEYLLDLRYEYGINTGNLRPVYEMFDNHLVGRLFKSAGYRYVHIGSWWDPTATSRNADETLGYQGGGSDFTEVLADTSLLAALPEEADVVQPGLRVQHREAALQQFPQIAEVARDRRPTFTFAHVLLPHEPYVFEADGGQLTEEEADARTEGENVAGHVAYTNSRIAELIDRLLDVPPDQQPIIILQADEGPHPPRSIGGNFNWEQATTSELVGKLAILNAWYVPEGLDVPLEEDQTPVNSFRLLFNHLYGGNFQILPEDTYIFRDNDHVYDFTDVTEQVAEALAGD